MAGSNYDPLNFYGGAPQRLDERRTLMPREVMGMNARQARAAANDVGDIKMTAREVPPDGWLLCNGQSVGRNSYPDLFEAIGTKYGSDSADTFKLPDFRDRMPIGVNEGVAPVDDLGKTGGAKQQTLTVAQLPAHNHGINDPGHNHGVNDPGHSHLSNTSGQTVFTAPSTNTTTDNRAGGFQQITWGNTSTNHVGVGIGIAGNSTGISTQNQGSGDPVDIMPPWLGVNFIIKY